MCKEIMKCKEVNAKNLLCQEINVQKEYQKVFTKNIFFPNFEEMFDLSGLFQHSFYLKKSQYKIII